MNFFILAFLDFTFDIFLSFFSMINSYFLSNFLALIVNVFLADVLLLNSIEEDIYPFLCKDSLILLPLLILLSKFGSLFLVSLL